MSEISATSLPKPAEIYLAGLKEFFSAHSRKPVKPGISVDGLLPPAIAAKSAEVGVSKGKLDLFSMFLLAVLAGAFIAMGAVFYTTVVTGAKAAGIPFGLTKLLGGLAFCLGLILVVVGGAELFTGNNLMIMSTISGKLSVRKLLRNWGVVFLGNFVGAVLTALIMYLSEQYKADGTNLGATAMKIADAKCRLGLVPALTRGIFCNALVCLAVWLTFSCRTTGDKILAILFPVTAFVAAGFEHSVANMYFVPVGIFVKSAAGATGYDALNWSNFLVNNLIPVTIGNVIGGVGFVALVYWIIYCRPKRQESQQEEARQKGAQTLPVAGQAALACCPPVAAKETEYPKKKMRTLEAVARLHREFCKRVGHTDCQSLSGLDLTPPEGRKTLMGGVKADKCAKCVRAGAELLAKELQAV